MTQVRATPVGMRAASSHAHAPPLLTPWVFLHVAEEGRLNPNSVLLEGSMKLSQGNRIRLDLSKCASYRVFPGQVVVVKGTNPSGFCVVASEVLPGLPLPFKCTPVEELVQLAEGRSAQGQSYIIAAGPYTTPEDLDYEPLTALLECCTAHRPDMLLLLGPFVDVDHPLIRGGMLDETFDDVFHSRVAGPLNEYMTETGGRTRVVLMPSTRDVHHDPVFPQPPLEATGDAIHVANPCTFSCNDVVLGCSTADWLMAGTKEEISQSEQRADRLPALASHLIAQRRQAACLKFHVCSAVTGFFTASLPTCCAAISPCSLRPWTLPWTPPGQLQSSLFARQTYCWCHQTSHPLPRCLLRRWPSWRQRTGCRQLGARRATWCASTLAG